MLTAAALPSAAMWSPTITTVRLNGRIGRIDYVDMREGNRCVLNLRTRNENDSNADQKQEVLE
jgi:hypothetical protein